MTPKELYDALDRLGWTQSTFAARLATYADRDEGSAVDQRRSIVRWIRGETAVPPAVAWLLETLEDLEKLRALVGPLGDVAQAAERHAAPPRSGRGRPPRRPAEKAAPTA